MADKKTQSIDLGITKQDMGREVRAVLELKTDKGFRSDIRSDATVNWHGDGFHSHVLFGDFSKTVKTVPSRATQKAIDSQHAAVFTPEVIQALTAEAKAYYAEVPANG